jgi:hypothetical protein
MQNAQQNQLMSTVLIIFCVLGAVTTAFLTIFSRNPIHSLYLVVFHNGALSSVELFLAIVHIITLDDYDFIFIHHHVDEPE